MKPENQTTRRRKLRIRDELIFDTLMEMVQVDPEKTVRPEDVAMSLHREEWQGLLSRIRLFSRQLAREGYLHIIRKGKVADPDDFKGVYRLQATENAVQYVPRMPPESPQQG